MDTFEKFRRKPVQLQSDRVASDVFFQILFDETGAYLMVIDPKGKEIDADYRYYHGGVRELLRTIERIKEKQQFHVSWEGDGERLYLAEHEFIMWHLCHSDTLIDAKKNRLFFVEQPASLVLAIEEESETMLCGRLRLSHTDETQRIRVLSEQYVLSGVHIYKIPPLTENFVDLPVFETTFQKSDFENYLSIFYSHMGEIRVQYQDFTCVDEPPKTTQASLIFEKVDAQKCLYLKISGSVEGMDTDFFESYDIHKLAVLNDMERQIHVSPIIQGDFYACYKKIQKMLTGHRQKLKGEEQADFFVEDNCFIIEERLAQAFIHEELSGLIAMYPLFGTEKLKPYKVQAVTPRLNLSMGHGIDFLEGDASLEIEGETFSLFDALTQYRKNSYIALNDGTHALLNQNYIHRLERIFKKQKGKKEVKISFFDLPAVEEMIDEKTAQTAFSQSRAIFEGFNTLQKQRTALPKIEATLRPYQKQGYKWLKYLQKHNLGGCLADDMGLGKTVQAITLLSSLYPKTKKPSLLIMPKSLIFNWQSELERFAPQLSFHVFYGGSKNVGEAMKSQLILITYGMIRNNIEVFQSKSFHTIILDESQSIKNIQSQTSKAVMLLNATHRLALSGTPIENNLSELYALFRFLNPSMFGSVEEFNRNYLVPVQKNNDKDAIRELRMKIYPFILRRLKKDVLKELPDKVENILHVEMSSEQKSLYNRRRLFYQENLKTHIQTNGIQKSQFVIFQALNELRQIASIPEMQSDGTIRSPKRDILIEHILESTANQHKVLVFGNFINIVERVGEDLQEAGINYLVMTGATRDRGAIVERFQNDPSVQVFLMTLKTGGLGLNLTKADTIFIFDPWWNMAAENQAIDRSHRMGQDKTVFSYKLITNGTIEDKIMLLQEKKKALFESVISSDSASIKSLNEDDINFILG